MFFRDYRFRVVLPSVDFFEPDCFADLIRWSSLRSRRDLMPDGVYCSPCFGSDGSPTGRFRILYIVPEDAPYTGMVLSRTSRGGVSYVMRSSVCDIKRVHDIVHFMITDRRSYSRSSVALFLASALRSDDEGRKLSGLFMAGQCDRSLPSSFNALKG